MYRYACAIAHLKGRDVQGLKAKLDQTYVDALLTLIQELTFPERMVVFRLCDHHTALALLARCGLEQHQELISPVFYEHMLAVFPTHNVGFSHPLCSDASRIGAGSGFPCGHHNAQKRPRPVELRRIGNVLLYQRKRDWFVLEGGMP